MISLYTQKLMCIGGGGGGPAPAAAAPAPIQPRQPDLIQAARLPGKKELLDPDDTVGVEYGTADKKEGGSQVRGAAKRTGTDALKIDLNTAGTNAGSGTGGANV